MWLLPSGSIKEHRRIFLLCGDRRLYGSLERGRCFARLCCQQSSIVRDLAPGVQACVFGKMVASLRGWEIQNKVEEEIQTNWFRRKVCVFNNEILTSLASK